MDNVFDLLKKNDIEVALITIESGGYYNPDLKIMFINQELDEEEQKEVILHELGHALNHTDFSSLYNNKNPIFRSKMENEANAYMIKYLINESEGQFNYSNVLENYNLGLGWENKIR